MNLLSIMLSEMLALGRPADSGAVGLAAADDDDASSSEKL